jgi:rSAM/selenodomain-associated transferase 2
MPAATPATLSIVVPVLDEAAGVAAMLDALAPLRARGAELVVVDGGSGDHTVALARPRADLVITAPRGRARQMKAGAAHARGAWLLFLHADTRLPDAADAAIAAALASAPTDRAWGRFDVRIAGRAPMLPVIAALMNLRSRWSGIATGDQAIFMTRAAYDAAGGFPDQPLMEDIEISKRLRRIVRPICLRERVTTSGRRWEQRGVWRTIVLMWRLRFLYWLGVSAERLAPQYR